jgi:hypothetical protein
VVQQTGTHYAAATLSAQVHGVLAALHGRVTSSGAVPSATPSAAGTPSFQNQLDEALPSSTLIGCVEHLTGHVHPILVDKATYQGKPAYVIALATQAWVVGTGCTASHPELITTVTFPAAP